MLCVVKMEWTAQHVPKVIELRNKFGPGGPGINILGEALLFGRHKYVGIWEATDEKAAFKALSPYLGVTTFEILPACTPEEAIKIATEK